MSTPPTHEGQLALPDLTNFVAARGDRWQISWNRISGECTCKRMTNFGNKVLRSDATPQQIAEYADDVDRRDLKSDKELR